MRHHRAIGWILGLTALAVGCAHRSDTASPADEVQAASVESPPATVETSPPPDSPSATDSETESSIVVRGEGPGEQPEALAAEASAAEPAESAPPSTVPALVPDANLSIESVEADGQRLRGLACRADRLPLFGSLAVVASIAEQKRALDRCAPEGAAVALTWESREGKARGIEVRGASPSKAGSCVAKVMRKTVAPFNARCGAVVLVGEPDGADRALETLSLGE